MKKAKCKKILAGIVLSVFAVSNLGMTANAAISRKANAAYVEKYKTTLGQNAKPVPNDRVDLNRKLVGYFPSWAYASEQQSYFNATDLQWDELTHIQYSFGFIDEQTHKLYIDDSATKPTQEDFEKYSDCMYTQNGRNEKVTLDPSLPYKGHFNMLQTMKKKYNPDVKLMLSIGGWTGCKGFYPMLKTDAGIETFADSCIDFLETYNFDGIDIDFEYPTAESGAGNVEQDGIYSEAMRPILCQRYNVLMRVLREKIDEYNAKKNKDCKLTAAVTASAWVLGGVDDNTYAQYLDFLSVMSYDFHGAWNQFVENQANIYSDPADTETKEQALPYLSMDWAYKYYRGVLPAERILMGIPYYTRGWEDVGGGTNGLHGTAGSKEAPKGATGKYNIWGDPKNADKPELGLVPAGANPLWHVKNLLESDDHLNEHWDDVGKVPYVWQDEEKVFLSYENERSIQERNKYIEEKNLGGALIWVMNGDYGKNPNYKEGSSDPNEGKYCYGNTLTKTLKDGLDKMGKCEQSKPDYDESNLAPIDVEVTVKNTYAHPNGYLDITVKNTSGESLPKGYEVQFDMPQTAVYQGTIGGTATVTPVGDFNRITIKSTNYAGLPAGASDTIRVSNKLCISGIRNMRVNGMVPSNEAINGNYLPSLKGVKDMIVTEGSNFNPMEGVKSEDNEDGDITKNVKYFGKVDTKKPGIYNLRYYVQDSAGFMVVKDCDVYVVPKEYAGIKVWNGGDVYDGQKQTVIHKGKIYESTVWYIGPGNEPGVSSMWKEIMSLPDYRTQLPNPKPEKPQPENPDSNVITLAEIAQRYNVKKGQKLYEAKYDLVKDGIIDVHDLAKLAGTL